MLMRNRYKDERADAGKILASLFCFCFSQISMRRIKILGMMGWTCLQVPLIVSF